MSFLYHFWFQILSLNRCILEDSISENTINLVSNDAQAIERSIYYSFIFTLVPLDILCALALMWYLVAWQAMIGASIFLLVSVYNSVAASKAGKIRNKAAAQTDKRLTVIKEIVTGIRVVKMYAWEWNFRDLIAQIRRFEPSFHYGYLILFSKKSPIRCCHSGIIHSFKSSANRRCK